MEAFTITSIAFIEVVPNALKHTIAHGPHVPVESQLLAREMAGLFREKLEARAGDRLPVSFAGDLAQALRIHLNSQTSANSFREMVADLEPGGTCTVLHYLEHGDRAQFDRLNSELRQLPYFYEVDLAEPSA